MRASTYFGPGGHEFADAVNSQAIVFWGGNDAETRFVDFPFVREAQQRGARVICIDPNRSATASRADAWISLRPGTDAALALGLLHEIVSQGWHDQAYLRAHTNGPFLVREDNGALLRQGDLTGGERDLTGGERDLSKGERNVTTNTTNACMAWIAGAPAPVSGAASEQMALEGRYDIRLAGCNTIRCATVFQLLREQAAAYTLQRTSDITTIAVDTIRALASDLARRKPAAVRIGYGVDRWYWSDHTSRAVATLVIATGNIGVAGGGISVHSGSYALPGSLMAFRNPGGKSPDLLDAMPLMSAIESGRPYPLRALWLNGSSLFNHSPHRIHSTFANMPMLKKLEPEALLELHPEDAAARGLADGDMVRVFNERGTVTLRCRHSERLRNGVLVLPEGHWVKDFRAGDPYSLTHELVSETSENYAFYDTLVQAERVAV